MEGVVTEQSGNGAAGAQAPKLKRSMGVWMATALVIGNMVGSGIFLLPALLAAAGEVKDPEKNIPRATIYGTLAATAVYILGTIAVMGVIPTGELANSTSPFAAAAGQMFGGSWNKVIALVALFSWWQAKQAERQAAELVATPASVRSPGREGAVVALRESC